MDHPSLNALLNLISATLLVAGGLAIRARRFELHKRLMLTAFGSSALFLTSYLIYHSQVGHNTCVATGWVKTAYSLLLWPHVVLAAVMVPLILRTLQLAWRDDRARHRRLARVTLPIWLYVSVTGVLIWAFVYVLFPGPDYFIPAGLP